MKILIIKFRNIGDTLLVSPLIENLKMKFPDSKIDIAINKDSYEVVKNNPNINQIFSYDRDYIYKKSRLTKAILELKFFINFKKKYDIVINLTEGDRGAIISFMTKSRVKIGFSKNKILNLIYTHSLPSQGDRHVIDVNLDPLRILEIPIISKKVKYYWNKSDELSLRNRFKHSGDYIHIHPVSRWLFKCLPDQKMAEIVDFCEIEMNLKVVITAAPVQKEIAKVNNILKNCSSSPINLSGKLTLSETACLNYGARLFLGVDTAVMHISAANNIPVISFFGPSGARHWGPWDNKLMSSNYMNINGNQTNGIHEVISQSRKCQPCGKDGCNGSKISDCLVDLDSSLIKATIRNKLDES